MRARVWVAVAALVCGTAGAAGAGARPPAPVPVFTPASGAELAELLADAPQVARDLGVPLADAARRLRLQPAAGQLQQYAARRWPATFGGLWIDAAGRVQVAFTRNADANVRALRAGFPDPAALVARRVARPWSSLLALQARMVADRELARAGRLAFPGVHGHRYDLDVDVVRNTVVVVVDTAAPETAAAFRARYGDVAVDAMRLARPQCSALDCRYALRSGVANDIYFGRDCTTGFTVNTGSGHQILSAGHCDTSQRRHRDEIFGSLTSWAFGGKVDASLNSVDLGGFYAGSWIYVDSGTQARRVTGSQAYASMTVGTTVCTSGASTGYQCGTVSSVTFAPHYLPSGNSFLKTNLCTQGGDSGAGVFIGSTAVGLVSGGTGGCGGTNHNITGHIEFALSTLGGLSVSTSDTAPVYQSVTAVGGEKRVTLRFSKPVRCFSVSASDFTVRVNNAVTYTTTVPECTSDADPTIVVNLNAPLIPSTSVAVSFSSGALTDPYGTSVAGGTKTTTVTPIPL